ncbi:Retrovirus-related Pol polyprotein [Aphis craccivora]|uniref:Retrovirus-related Pol polyprotein n=1 Tax=Aphis craccivora TaxID=307492 RepID=A0A6G0YAW3_APHCR|nr:Retrovirus-related Pol polyprotein [Aphis craccivora]
MTTFKHQIPPNLLTNIKIGTNIGALDEQSVIYTVDRTEYYIKKNNLLTINKPNNDVCDNRDLNCAKVEECEIKLSLKDPVFQAPHRVSPKQRKKLKKSNR